MWTPKYAPIVGLALCACAASDTPNMTSQTESKNAQPKTEKKRSQQPASVTCAAVAIRFTAILKGGPRTEEHYLDSCTNAKWSLALRQCVADAATKPQLKQCIKAAQNQSLAEAMRILCDAPTKSGAHKTKYPSEKLRRVSRYTLERIRNEEVSSTIVASSDADHQERAKFFQPLIKQAGLQHCEFLDFMAKY